MNPDQIQAAVVLAAIASGMLYVLRLGLQDRRAMLNRAGDSILTLVLLAGGLSGAVAVLVCVVARAIFR